MTGSAGFLLHQAQARAERAFPEMMDAVHGMKGPALPSGKTVLLGDSITQAIPAFLVGPHVYELGVAGSTSADLARRVQTYKWIQKAGRIVVAVGVNDLVKGRVIDTISNMTVILRALPASAPVYVSAILQVNEEKLGKLGMNARIDILNSGYRQLCAERPNTFYVAHPEMGNGTLLEAHDIGDGLHLSPTGYAAWTDRLRAALSPL